MTEAAGFALAALPGHGFGKMSSAPAIPIALGNDCGGDQLTTTWRRQSELAYHGDDDRLCLGRVRCDTVADALLFHLLFIWEII